MFIHLLLIFLYLISTNNQAENFDALFFEIFETRDIFEKISRRILGTHWRVLAIDIYIFEKISRRILGKGIFTEFLKRKIKIKTH